MSVEKRVGDFVNTVRRGFNTLVSGKVGGLIKQTYITKTPADEETLKRMISREHANIAAENVKLKSKIEQEEKRKRDALEQKRLQKELNKFLEKEKRIEKDRKVRIKIDTKMSSPSVFTRSNKLLGKLSGFELRESPDGDMLWYLLLMNGTNGDKKKIGRFVRPAMDFSDIFKEKKFVISQLRGGKLDTNFDIVDGQPILHRDMYWDEDAKEKVKLVHLEDTERMKYEKELKRQEKVIQKLYKMAEDAKEKESEYQVEVAEKDLAIKTANKLADGYGASLANVMEKAVNLTTEYANLTGAVNDARLDRVITQRQNRGLVGVIDDLNGQINEIRSMGGHTRQTEERLLELQSRLESMAQSTETRLSKRPKEVVKIVEKNAPAEEGKEEKE